MTKEAAINAMEQGGYKVAHRFFSEGEYIWSPMKTMFDFIDWFFDIGLGNLSRETWRNRQHYDNTQEPKDRFTSEQREYLDKIKTLAVDVEYEEIQS